MALNWTIIGTGVIAKEMANAFNNHHRDIYAVFSRHSDNALAFADNYGITKKFNTLAAVFSDSNVDAVYIATPHNTHFNIAKQALMSGKHVLMEKSITTNKHDLDQLKQIANENNLLLMEAMTLVHMPLMKKLKSAINDGLLGQVKIINVTFGSHKPYDAQNRFFNPTLGGGALLDIGVYAVAGARYFMSSQPQNVHSFVNYAPTGVDEQSVTILNNIQNEMATISLSLQAKQPKALTVSGTKGYFRILEFPRAQEAIWYHTETGQTELIESGHTEDALFYEISDFELVLENPKKYTMYETITSDVFSIFENMKQQWDE